MVKTTIDQRPTLSWLRKKHAWFLACLCRKKGEGWEWVIYEGGQCRRNGIERRGCCCIFSRSFVYLHVLLVYKTTFLIRDTSVSSQMTHLGPPQDLRSFLRFSTRPSGDGTARWPQSLGLAHGREVVWTQNPAAFQPVLAGDERGPKGGACLEIRPRVKGDGSRHWGPVKRLLHREVLSELPLSSSAGLQWRPYHHNGHKRRCWQQRKPQPPSFIQPSQPSLPSSRLHRA